jgi:hypothetical protein
MATENVNMNIETTTTPVQTETTPAQTVTPGNVQLTAEMLSKVQVSVNMKFLADIRNVIDVATQRGAWRANELTSVGTIIDSLDNAFKELASKSNEVATAANESEETEPVAAEPKYN